jgi:anti-sigma factor RsiW
MNCPDIRASLVEFLDGRLAPGRAADVRAHLESCSDCRREADLHRQTWELTGKVGELEPAASFGASVRRRVRRSKVSLLIGSCAAAAAIVAALVISPWRQPTAPAVEDVALRRLAPEDRRLLEELAADRTWEIAENMDVLRALEVLDRDGVNGEEGH